MLALIIVQTIFGCTGVDSPDSSTSCENETWSVEDWIGEAAAAECVYFTRCLEQEYPGYGESAECPGDAAEAHLSYTEDGDKCVDPCAAEEFLSSYLEAPCDTSSGPLPHSFSHAYFDCDE